MNDADFELLTKEAIMETLRNGVKPWTLPTDIWLRVRAMELAVDSKASRASAGTEVTASAEDLAERFYKFMTKKESL